jgi:fermentation-respiration switch protein FrsA (DUF1100 family)
VAVVSTLTRLRDLHHGFGPLARFAPFDSLRRIPQVAAPIFIAHGDRDQTIRFEHGERLFAAAREPKRFFRATGAGHANIFDSPGLLDAIAAFSCQVAADGRNIHGPH